MGAKLSIDIIKDRIKGTGYKCLSDTYINNTTKLEWFRESCGHKWEATWLSFSQTSGDKCPHCAPNRTKTYQEVVEKAQKLGFECLCKEEDYINTSQMLEWRCPAGHEFTRTASKLLQTEKCPKCNKRFYSQEKCRIIFEMSFGEKFPERRNVLEYGLQLDGYNERFKLAFEYNGLQHYEYVPAFHKTKKNFKEQQKRDKLKVKLCKEKGINLIIIPYKAAEEDKLLLNYINKKLMDLGYEFQNLSEFPIKEFYDSLSQLNELREIARAKGGELISEVYLGAHVNHEWRCKKCGHEWKNSPSNIKHNKQWCPKCAHNMKKSLAYCRQRAAEKGEKCKCHATEYMNCTIPIEWECDEGHRFMMSLRDTKKHWCPECAKERVAASHRDTIENMQFLAGKKNGWCLSPEYGKNQNHALVWMDENKFMWSTTPASIKQGHWSPLIAGKKRYTLKDCHWIASQHGGCCLETKYKDCMTPMRWKCKNEHVFSLPLICVIGKRKQWCRECYDEERRDTIEKMNLLAKERDEKGKGKCLSEKYGKNEREPLEWQDWKGHTWWSAPKNIKAGSWCTTCANEKRIEKLRKYHANRKMNGQNRDNSPS